MSYYPEQPYDPVAERERRATNAVRYRCHKLRASLWNMDDKKERMNANHWIVGHIGESLKTANLEELERLEFYMTQKIANGHCPLHIEENASTRYKRDGGSTTARKKVKEKLIELYGERCADCQRGDIPLTLDHIHPISMGGKNEVANCQLLCVPCHTKKTKVDSKMAFERYFAENFPEKLAAMKAAQEERRQAKQAARATRDVPTPIITDNTAPTKTRRPYVRRPRRYVAPENDGAKTDAILDRP